jgi:hypothetical protein
MEIDTAQLQVAVLADSPPTIFVSIAELVEHPHNSLVLHE